MTSFPAKTESSLWRSVSGPALGLLFLVLLGRWAGGYWPAIEGQLAALGPVGHFVFCGAWVVLASFCFPVSVLGFSAGAVFGFITGLSLVFIAANAAALLIFALGRGLLRGRIRAMVATRPKLAAVDRLVGERALRLNVLTRLSPLNYGLACYTLAAGRTSLRTYLWGNLGTVPSMVLQVWLGSVAARTGQSATGHGLGRWELIVVVVAILFFGVLSWQVARLVREAFNEAERRVVAREMGDS